MSRVGPRLQVICQIKSAIRINRSVQPHTTSVACFILYVLGRRRFHLGVWGCVCGCVCVGVGVCVYVLHVPEHRTHVQHTYKNKCFFVILNVLQAYTL